MYSIAIDGPAGAGKSTVAKMVAQALSEKGLYTIYVDTGAIYRGVAYYLLQNISEEDLKKEAIIAENVEKLKVDIKYIDNIQHVYINDEDVTAEIRTSLVSKITSQIAAYKSVRLALIDIQRDIASKNNVVMDGRDIGTNILKNATLKIFLVASVEVRAKRRYDEATQRGETVEFDKIVQEITMRDNRDENRENAPTKQAEDAIKLDTSNMNIEEVVEKILEYFKYV